MKRVSRFNVKNTSEHDSSSLNNSKGKIKKSPIVAKPVFNRDSSEGMLRQAPFDPINEKAEAG